MTVIIRREDPKVARINFNPLATDNDPLPLMWNGPHVSTRIAEGFMTLAKMPRRDRMGMRSCWPEYAHTFEDLTGQAEQGELERTMQQQNRVRIAPSAQEIARMEASTYWPAQYLSAKPQLREAVNMVSLAHSLGFDAGRVAKERGRVADTWRERHDMGCELIAAGLIRDRVKVF
jgi:hypothetical protein